ncbi:MAG: Rpn family recombination-promoting nuclease/putative transposase [Roseburia sp.]|nr:Rpn family recombination-promoting nuclease/putative transposase [Roseburia sp.]
MDIITLKFDLTTKELFRNKIVLKYFVSDVLDMPLEKIRSVRLLNTFLWRRYRWQKQGILDVLVELNDNTKINIELQISRYANWDKRSLFYLAKMYTEDLRIGENYAKLKRCIHISILDFILTDGEKYHTIYRLRDEYGNEFSDVFEIHIIELCKELNGKERMDDWVKLYNAKNEEDLDMIQTTNAGIMEAIKEVKIMSLDKRLRLRYEEHMKAIRDRNAREEYVREEGRLKGREEGIYNLIQKKLANGESIPKIATDLLDTPEHIEQIIEHMKELP